MKNFIKLVNFELNRFFPIYAALGILTIILQIVGVFVTANDYIYQVNEQIKMGIIKESAVILEIGRMGMDRFTSSLWFWAPIALCVVTLIIYSLFIWYRDWLGKNTFIYRLLMLPTERLNVYFSKAAAIFIMVLGLVALQLVLLVVERQLFSMLIPAVYIKTSTISQIIQGSNQLLLLYPASFIAAVANYSRGFIAILVLFTLILLERSFKFKGLLLAGVYSVLTLVCLFSPYWLQAIFNRQLFFTSEIFWISLALTFVIGAVSVWISHHLLNKRITV
ncbi:hypothetical protein [Desemzia sp. FAM 23991]|uniref:hypothetical protein n=1 Tax=unclassified Desemzia TaxID=2685243 RepID=UPI0038887003